MERITHVEMVASTVTQIIAAELLLPRFSIIFALLSIFLTLMLYTPLIYVLQSALLIYNAYITLPVAMLPISLVIGTVEFTR